MKIYNYGSINIDHIYQVPHLVGPGETISSTKYHQVLGGKGANQSIALARAGAEVHHIGRCNKADGWAVNELISAGVLCDLVELVETPSGHAVIQVDAQAENSIVLYGGANQSYTKPDLELALTNAKKNDWLVLQNECSCINDVIEIAYRKEMKIAVNPSPMFEDLTGFPFDKVSMLIVNEVELGQLLGCSIALNTQNDFDVLTAQVTDRFSNKEVVITLGSQGAIWVSDGGYVQVDAFKVEVVDTTAAGDTFLGYLLAQTVQGEGKKEALITACKASSIAVQSLGASCSIPTTEQVASVLAK